ncbi:GtrA family protein [Xylophilus rhododendri]|uniref:GtrA family protein n=1 Tax=Xylophilus rhododendri TaxID=2697032 RepID=A0A857J2E9_9BURK|nr:GtrA family protein [Xylophilus rhododendri]QHI97916.1 GtrA family protein [Xylophilus rhododendri]
MRVEPSEKRVAWRSAAGAVSRLEFVRFLFVGVLNSAFGYGCFAALLFLGLHYALAQLLATVCGVLFNFMTTGRLVFGSASPRLLGRFVLVYGVVYGCNVAGLAMLLHFGIGAYAAGALMLVPMAVLSYLLSKFFVFTHAQTH